MNRDQVPPIGGRADSWYASYVRKILFNRAVLGEMQPHVMRDGKRIPQGQPIEAFFPAVVDKALWHRAHRAIKSRRKRPSGRADAWVGLMSGLLVDSLGSTWIHLCKNGRHQFVSDKGRRAVKGHEYASVPAESFEQLLLLMLQLTWEPRQVEKEGTDNKVEAAEAELTDVRARLEAVREGIATGDPATVKTLVAMVPDLERRHADLEAEVEQLQAEATGGGAELLPSLAEDFIADPTDRKLRLQLRQVIRDHVNRVVIQNREQVACEPMKDPDTGRWIKRHAGQWVDVQVRLTDGNERAAQLFLPLRAGTPALRLDRHAVDDLAGWAAMGATNRVTYKLDSKGAPFHLLDEPLPPPPMKA
ncbi:MAG: recombinase family protein, partial [Phycisphaeraceae bacterium]